MAVYTDVNNLPAIKNAVLTIGTFDGVHLGHRAILQQVIEMANDTGGESIVITFEPHPRKLLFPEQELKILTPLQKKLELIHEAGIKHVVVTPFTHEFANLSAKEYIENYLIKKFNPAVIVIGYDHRFGHDRKGDINMLMDEAHIHGYKVVEIPAQLIDEATVSSTKIRKAVMEGHLQEAAHMLGRPYSIAGTVIKGRQLGRGLGYPTANLQLQDPEQIIPANGIYATRSTYKGTQYGSMSSIGYNPTVTNEKQLHIETNIFDFGKDIYNETLEVSFISKLRDEVKFESLDALKKQLAKDKEDTLSALS